MQIRPTGHRPDIDRFGALLQLILEVSDVLFEVWFFGKPAANSSMGVRNCTVIVAAEVPGDIPDRFGSHLAA